MNKLLYIWSKDRPAQLETYLSSIYQFKMSNHYDIEVIYTTKDIPEDGYNKLINNFNGVTFTKQEDAKSQLINSCKKYKYICISTDDTWLFREVEDIEQYMDKCFVFSYRLGFNTVIQDHFKQTYQAALTLYEEFGSVLRWNSKDYYNLNNYGYIFGLDGHVYHTDKLIPLLSKINFYNPPSLERELFQFHNIVDPYMCSFKESCMVNIPINSTGGVTNFIGETTKELYEKFSQGYQLNYIKQPIMGCHQNVPYIMEKI